MNTLKVKNITIGEGLPKICVSITGKNINEITNQAIEIYDSCADIAEWRVDYFEDVFKFDTVINTLNKIREILVDTPIIFTFRTDNEGGNLHINVKDYIELNKIICDSNLADFVDIELDTATEYVSEMVEYCHNHNCYLICSHHNFNQTPSTQVMISILEKMNDLNCDILKLAVMPNDKLDVINLLTATTTAKVQHPVVTMSMSKLGAISRISGEIFGSSITFGSIGECSAPGQIEINSLRKTLDLLHN